MDTISILKIAKGNNSAKNVGGVTVVYLCTLYISTKFCEIISNGSGYDFYTENYKGNNYAKNVGGVIVVNLCTSSGHALYFYQVL